MGIAAFGESEKYQILQSSAKTRSMLRKYSSAVGEVTGIFMSASLTETHTLSVASILIRGKFTVHSRPLVVKRSEFVKMTKARWTCRTKMFHWFFSPGRPVSLSFSHSRSWSPSLCLHSLLEDAGFTLEAVAVRQFGKYCLQMFDVTTLSWDIDGVQFWIWQHAFKSSKKLHTSIYWRSSRNIAICLLHHAEVCSLLGFFGNH